MSAYIRATPPPSSAGRHGSSENVVASGIAIMSDSSIALKPVIEDPSKPMPPSNASSRSAALIANDFSWPRMSVNQRRMKRMPRASTAALTSSGVLGVSAMEADPTLRRGDLSWTGGPGSAEPLVGPRLELFHRGRKRPAHRRQLVLDPDRGVRMHVALDHPARLELLHALGQQPVGDVGDALRDLREA